MSKRLRECCVIVVALLLLIGAADIRADLLLHLDGSATASQAGGIAFCDRAKLNDALPTDHESGTTGLGVISEVVQNMYGAVGDTAMRFGANEHVAADIPSITSDFNRTYQALTLSFWYKPHADTDTDVEVNFLMGKMGLDTDRGWQLLRKDDSDDLQWLYFDGPSGARQTVDITNTGLNSSDFTHVVITFAGGQSVRAFVNGGLHTEAAATLAEVNGVNSVPFQVGNRGLNARGSADGLIDEVGLWDEVVSPARIAAMYALARFEDAHLQSAAIDDLLEAFAAQGAATINCHRWQYTTGLVGAQGAIGGRMATGNAYVVLDTQGNGMALVADDAGPLQADIDGDCLVDGADLSRLVDCWLQQPLGDDGPELLHEYTVSGYTAKFGDVDGDGKTDIMTFDPNWSTHVYAHDGTELWSYDAPSTYAEQRAGFEAPGVIWDFDQDGYGEVLHWRRINDVEYLVMADGLTGQIIRQTPWPTFSPDPHAYYNFRIAIAKLAPGYPSHIVVLTDPSNIEKLITTYNAYFLQLWQYSRDMEKDALGHYPYPIDLDGDGLDEVAASHLLLDSDGTVVWDNFDVFPDNDDHADSLRFVDVTGDDTPEVLCPTSDIGVIACDAMTGAILWQSDAAHAQQIETGDFLDTISGPHIAVTARYYNMNNVYLSAQIHWIDDEGNAVKKWPASPIPGNPDFVKGDWNGDGRSVLFWHTYRITGRGTGQAYFSGDVYHMFDFTADGAEEAIVKVNLPEGRSILRIYGSRAANRSSSVVSHDPEYIRYRIANHTHY